jgi:RNA polymerase sigma-70 factor (ECF subfamily)
MGSPRAAPASAEIAAPGGEPLHVEIPTFARLYEDYFDFVWCSARRLGVPDAALDDAAQEVFVIVHRRLEEFEGRSSVKTWLFGIVRNVSREARRSIRRKSPHDAQGALADPDLLTASADERPDRIAERSAENRVLHELLDRLDDEKREVFVLAELEQFTVPEIAEAVGCNVNTAYSRLRLARVAFAEAAARYRARENACDDQRAR